MSFSLNGRWVVETEELQEMLFKGETQNATRDNQQ